jgi:DNA-binding transcriptional LysR family regulator
MQAYIAVVDAGRFVRGADALQMSKSAVSRLVAELEQRWGVRLLQRTTRLLSLTREGELFRERCRDLLSDVGDAAAEVTRHAGEVSGELRVSAPVSFGLMHLAPLWPVLWLGTRH